MAVALAAGLHDNEDETKAVVLDFGAATFDVSIMSSSAGVIEIKSRQYDLNLGGNDVDQILFEHCEKTYEGENNFPLSETALDYDIQKKRLMAECERVKIILSEQFDANVLVAQTDEEENE